MCPREAVPGFAGTCQATARAARGFFSTTRNGSTGILDVLFDECQRICTRGRQCRAVFCVGSRAGAGRRTVSSECSEGVALTRPGATSGRSRPVPVFTVSASGSCLTCRRAQTWGKRREPQAVKRLPCGRTACRRCRLVLRCPLLRGSVAAVLRVLRRRFEGRNLSAASGWN